MNDATRGKIGAVMHAAGMAMIDGFGNRPEGTSIEGYSFDDISQDEQDAFNEVLRKVIAGEPPAMDPSLMTTEDRVNLYVVNAVARTMIAIYS